MSSESAPRIERWLAEPLPRDVAQSIGRLARAGDVVHIAVMPDVHLSGDVCVGLAVATGTRLYPAAVGGDIGCGMAAIATNAAADLLSNPRAASQLLEGLPAAVPAMRHPRATMPPLPAELLADPPSARAGKPLLRDGCVQFGTLGRGNHFLEFQADEDQRMWLMLHSGSRAMGQAITVNHVAIAERLSGRRRLPWLDAHSPEGRAYLADAAWAVRYAQQSRLAMLRSVERLLHRHFGLELDWSTLIHGDHNHVRQETHFGQSLWVHRKGALPAAEGQVGVIPGSMGTASFHVMGRGCAESLCSSSHGAGRALPRGEAARRLSPKQLARQMDGVWYDVRLASRLCDEAPSAYKDVLAVMRAQRELTRIHRKLRPLLSYKGT